MSDSLKELGGMKNLRQQVKTGKRLLVRSNLDVDAKHFARVSRDMGYANENAIPLAKLDTGLHAKTRIQTLSGTVAIEELRSGTTVLDPNGDPAVIRARLIAPKVRHALRFRSPYFGLDRDLVVGIKQGLTITSDIAQYLFGMETVSVPAWALRDDRRVLHYEMSSREHLYQLQLDREASLVVGKCTVSSFQKFGADALKVLNTYEAHCFAAEYRVETHS